ncbi:helix-turn-helix domain-containing protein [Sulfolobus acidocaldarius]|uniref:helix-turn-helix domain-containing protein n=1 Tax=Sulfolobus acidocaldarius TaxID=2285 RepID=UPI001E2EF58C|nr:helix-turn-helix domain-containing protein [Sulfolobus acidocaldarius]
MMQIYKVRMRVKHDACWTQETSGYDVTANVKYLFPLVAKNSVFEIVELYSNTKTQLTDFIDVLSRKYRNNIKIIRVDRNKSSKTALLYYFKNFENSITKAMMNSNAIVVNLTVSDGIEDWQVYTFNKRDQLETQISEELKKINVEVENLDFDRVEMDEVKSEMMILSSLTPTERQILYTAYKMGFFDYPKKTKLEELAKMYGVTKVALDRHIRNAIRKVLMQVFVDNSNKF